VDKPETEKDFYSKFNLDWHKKNDLFPVIADAGIGQMMPCHSSISTSIRENFNWFTMSVFWLPSPAEGRSALRNYEERVSEIIWNNPKWIFGSGKSYRKLVTTDPK
jgi:hypothetical protein